MIWPRRSAKSDCEIAGQKHLGPRDLLFWGSCSRVDYGVGRAAAWAAVDCPRTICPTQLAESHAGWAARPTSWACLADKETFPLRTGFWLQGDYGSTPWLAIISLKAGKKLHPKENIMRSLVARTAPAIVFAVGAIMLGNLANADAAPKKWDQEGYGVCAQQAYDDWSAGKITTKTYKELAQGCCQLSGGPWVTDIGPAGGSCVAPAAAPVRTVRRGL